MSKNEYFVIALIIIASLTFILRISLYLFFSKKKVPKMVSYLSDILPFFIMPILVIYCIKDQVTSSYIDAICIISGILVTSIIHLWKKNTILSIMVGTAFYMIIIRII